MINLADPKSFSHLDPKDVFGSTQLLVSQCQQIWEDAKNINFPNDYKNVQNIVICGMGGSAYGGHVVLSAFKNEIKIPIVLNSGYHLPAFANDSTLVILTSYSGSTEETLSCAKEAKEKNCRISGVTSSGTLGSFLKDYPSLIFNPKNNPSGQPRLGTGYIVLGTAALLNKLEVLNLSDSDIQADIESLKKNEENIKEQAMEIAKNIKDFIPVIFAAEFLEGNAHIMRNQFNETAKSFSSFHEIPELNHHLMEGLKNPQNNKLKVLSISSQIYSENIKKRFELTKEVVKKNEIDVLEFKPMGISKLSQILETLSFGGYLTFYLGILYNQDPSLIPWVDYFKEQLKNG